MDRLRRRLPARPVARPAVGAVATVLALATLPVSIAAGGVLEERLGATRTDARQVKQQLTSVDRRQQVVVRQVSSLNARIARLDAPIAELDAEIERLEYRINGRERRIQQLKRDYIAQRRAIIRLNRELGSARDVLTSRLVAAYKGGQSGALSHLAGSGDLQELFARDEALERVVGLDETIIARIADTERSVRTKRARNHRVRRDIRDDIATIEADRATVAASRSELQARRDEVAAVRARRDAALAKLNSREQQLGRRLDDLEDDAKVLREAIRTGKVTYGGSVGASNPSGLIWPVQGPVVSPFGPRWGRMHEGIDIAIAAGNPIHAAAAGVVTYAGWMGGYGNMVVVQHGGSISSGYAHQSQISVAVGQPVGQGQVLGFIGCTGHCYGDHLHFETYVDGSPVDPMRFL